MSWIRTIPPEEATGQLAELYEAALNRAGRVYQIVQAMSLAPSVLDVSMQLYQRIMFGRGPLSRVERELIAVVVSKANACTY